MKRQHTITKDNNLRFYAPLLEDDVTDWVSGTAPTRGTAQVSWSTQYDAYNVVTTYGNQLGWVYNIPNVNVYSTPYQYSVVALVQVKSFNGTCDIVTFGNNGTNSAAIMETHRYTGFTTGVWHRLVQTLDDTTVKMYIDGNLVRTSTTSQFAALAPSSWTLQSVLDNITIGGGFWNYYYNAYLKDVRVYDKCLTQQEIQNL